MRLVRGVRGGLSVGVGAKCAPGTDWIPACPPPARTPSVTLASRPAVRGLRRNLTAHSRSATSDGRRARDDRPLPADADVGSIGRGGLRDVAAWKGKDHNVDLAIASKFPHLMSQAELVAVAVAEKERRHTAEEHDETQRPIRLADREGRLADQARSAAEHESDPGERARAAAEAAQPDAHGDRVREAGIPGLTAPNAATPRQASCGPRESRATSTPGCAPTSARRDPPRKRWGPRLRAVARRPARPGAEQPKLSARGLDR